MSLARVFLNDPVFVSLVKPGDSAPPEIEHYHYIVTAQQKDKELLRILRYEDPDSAIIFANTRADVRYVTAFLQRHHLDADMIQGEMTQSAREAVMRRIKAGELRFLVATDVAARGIDISDLSHVISYAAPEVARDVPAPHRPHRARRQARHGDLAGVGARHRQLPLPAAGEPHGDPASDRSRPTSRSRSARSGRLEVDLEHELRELDERERRLREEVHLPLVEKLAQSSEGRRKLAAVLFQWLDHKHVPAPVDDESDVAPRPTRGSADPPARCGGEEPAKRRRRRRRRSRQASAD